MFDAFCIDNFPEISVQFSSGMNRVQKVNILFVNISELRIEAALREEYPEIIEQDLWTSNTIIPAKNLRTQDILSKLTENQLLGILRKMQQEEFYEQIAGSTSNEDDLSVIPSIDRKEVEEMVQYGLRAANEAQQESTSQRYMNNNVNQEHLKEENFQLKSIIADLILENQRLKGYPGKKK